MLRNWSQIRTGGAFFWCAVLVCALLLGIYPWSAFVVIQYGSLGKDLGWTAVRQEGSWVVKQVAPAGPAAGFLHLGDRILAFNGEKRAVLLSPEVMLDLTRAGESYSVAVQSGGTVITKTLECRARKDQHDIFWIVSLLLVSLTFYSVGATLGILKSQDPVARLGFVFCILSAIHMVGMAMRPFRGVLPVPTVWLYALAYSVSFIPEAVGYHFASRFPSSPPEGRRWIWLRRFMYSYAFLLFIPHLFLNVLSALESTHSLPFLVSHFEWLDFYSVHKFAVAGVFFLVEPMAVVAVVRRNFSLISAQDDYRRLKWLVYGTCAALLPGLVYSIVVLLVAVTGNIEVTNSPLWFNFNRFTNVAVVIIPIILGYSVIKYRVLGIDVVLRQGFRYLLAKNSLRLILLTPWLGIAASMLFHPQTPLRDVFVRNSPPLCLATSVAAGLSLKFRKQLMLTIDRRFFRESYDREQILLSLIEEMNSVDTLQEMSQLVGSKLHAALHMQSLRVVYREPGTGDVSCRYVEANETGTFAIEHDSRIIRALQEGIADPARDSLDLRPEDRALLNDFELVVPIPGADTKVLGGLFLGPKKSEEPYTKRDRSLLHTIAAQFGVVAENVWLRRRVSNEERIRHDVLARLGPVLSLVKECKRCGACFDTTDSVCSRDGGELSLSLPIERILDGKYRLDRRIGTGSMGAVYEAWDMRLSRQVAIKIMMGRLFGDRTALRRFEREAHASAKLSHTNITTVYDYGLIEGGGAYLVMEFLPGGNLRSEITRGPIPTLVVARWVDELLAGVAAAHRAGVIHRDLKPENILVAHQDQGPEVIKILDFGVAKLWEKPWDKPTDRTITAEGHIVGTLGYMSPEQLSGKEVDERTDIFSVGVIVIEVLIGHRPFRASSPREMLAAMYRWDIHLDGAFSGVDRILRKCIAPDRADRYHNVAGLRAELVPALRKCAIVSTALCLDPGLTTTVEYHS
ncbi:MAG: protein kinase [Acidobacteriota bacterium]|nr:protein kinase [Acidobacteriota bacterium]